MNIIPSDRGSIILVLLLAVSVFTYTMNTLDVASPYGMYMEAESDAMPTGPYGGDPPEECECETFNVYCSSEEDMPEDCGDASACAVQAPACEMHIAPVPTGGCNLCNAGGCTTLNEGDPPLVIGGSDFLDSIDCTDSSIVTSPGKMVSCCLLLHEGDHLCEDRGELACDEYYATIVLTDCYADVFEEFCGGASPTWSDEDCSLVCSDIELFTGYTSYDLCMCEAIMDGGEPTAYGFLEGGDDITSEGCCDCIAECMDSGEESDSLPTKCVEEGWTEDNETVEDDCEALADDSAYNCFNYGGPSDFDSSDCATTTSTSSTSSSTSSSSSSSSTIPASTTTYSTPYGG